MNENEEIILRNWGYAGVCVIKACKDVNVNMTFKEFLGHCTTQGGNCGGMILSGIRKIAPEVWIAIPEKMGKRAFECICSVIQLIGIDTSC